MNIRNFRAWNDRKPLVTGAAAVLLAAALAIALFVTWSSGPDAGSPLEVRIGFQTIPNGEVIVRQQGWLETSLTEELGVTVRWLNFASGSDVNAALASGDIDIGLVGSTLFAIGVERGIPYELIWIFDVIGQGEALIARSGIAEVGDLRGRFVATPFGSTTHYTLLEALAQENLGAADVTLVDLKPQDIAAAWAKGDIDAAYVWEPTLSLIANQGGHVLVSSADLVADGVVTADLSAVRTEFRSQHPDVVRVYLEAQARAIRMINADRALAAQIIADAFDLETDQVVQQMNGFEYIDACEQFSPAWLAHDMVAIIADTAEFLYDQGILARIPDESEIASRIHANLLEPEEC